jgi:hypothetical protein
MRTGLSSRERITPERLNALMPKLRKMRIIRRGEEHLVRIDPRGGLIVLRSEAYGPQGANA